VGDVYYSLRKDMMMKIYLAYLYTTNSPFLVKAESKGEVVATLSNEGYCTPEEISDIMPIDELNYTSTGVVEL